MISALLFLMLLKNFELLFLFARIDAEGELFPLLVFLFGDDVDDIRRKLDSFFLLILILASGDEGDCFLTSDDMSMAAKIVDLLLSTTTTSFTTLLLFLLLLRLGDVDDDAEDLL